MTVSTLLRSFESKYSENYFRIIHYPNIHDLSSRQVRRKPTSYTHIIFFVTPIPFFCFYRFSFVGHTKFERKTVLPRPLREKVVRHESKLLLMDYCLVRFPKLRKEKGEKVLICVCKRYFCTTTKRHATIPFCFEKQVLHRHR